MKCNQDKGVGNFRQVTIGLYMKVLDLLQSSLQFIIKLLKDTIEESDKEIHKAKSRRVSITGTSVCLEFEVHPPPALGCALAHQRGRSNPVQEFLQSLIWVQPLSRSHQVRLKVPTLLSPGCFPWQSSPHPQELSKNHLI